MQIELRSRTIEPQRKAFTHLVRRYGDRPMSRYEEGSVDVQATENFHYRPTWNPARWQYDPEYSSLKLTDPYSFLDPRQFYYATYVQARAASDDAFSKTLSYIDSHGWVGVQPATWQAVITDVLLPLRHWEAGAQIITIEGARFAWGTTIEQCCTYAAFDRIGAAQRISQIGIVMAGGDDSLLAAAKRTWTGDPAMQGLRRIAEEMLVVQDWAIELVTVDLVDRMLYPLMFRYLDERAVAGGSAAYSMLAQHFTSWFADQRRWIDALFRAWLADPELAGDNLAALDAWLDERWAQAVYAVQDVAAAVDARADLGASEALAQIIAGVRADLAALGMTAPGGDL